MRWSDGEPFTSSDLLFWYTDFLLNKELSPVVPFWLQIGGQTVEVTAPDPYVVVFRFSAPYGLFLEMLAFRSSTMIIPKHYLQQFHPAYTEKEKLAERLKARGLDQWPQLFHLQTDYNGNPDLPTVKPFKVTVPLAGDRV